MMKYVKPVRTESALYYVLPNGQKHGKYMEFHFIWKDQVCTDKLRILCYYNNGILDGKFQSWHNNGQMESLLKYDNGKQKGVHKCWGYFGSLLSSRYYVLKN